MNTCKNTQVTYVCSLHISLHTRMPVMAIHAHSGVSTVGPSEARAPLTFSLLKVIIK